ncbi:MAG: aam 2, partial [Glaciihabitans sp.]|nr:aam 2 [Glaciihabitans sp.]
MASTATSPGPYIARFDGAALLAGYRSGALSPVDVATDVIADITERNPTINAFSSFEPGEVLAAARASEERWRRGEPLGAIDGVPCTVKENLNRAGMPARSGSAATSPHTPTRSSPVVERILEAGGVILGSTTMPDWGMLTSGVSSLHGITRSPLDPALTTGGSSSGAGASAAAGFGCFHIGTDIGGSIRLPASFLGLAALKPSDGRVPLDTPFQGRAAGPLAQSISDVSLAMAVISQPDERDYTALPPEDIRWGDLSLGRAGDLRGSRVALQLDAGAGIPVDPEVAAAVTAAAQVFADAGAEVVELAPFSTETTLEDVDIFWRVRFWRTYTELSTAAKARVLPVITECVRHGA